MTTIKSVTSCPTCGAECEIGVNGETHNYIPKTDGVASSADAFIAGFNRVAGEVHTTAVLKGWWEGERDDGNLLMLMVCEVAEACEGLRHDNPPSDHIPEFSAVEEEMADVIIRIMDFCSARNHRVAEAIVAKAEFNKGRSHKHGGKKF